MNKATNETAPLHIWLDNVLIEAKVSVEQLEPFRSMIVRQYSAGEPVWMAADGLRILVKEQANEIRRERMSKDGVLASIRKVLRGDTE